MRLRRLVETDIPEVSRFLSRLSASPESHNANVAGSPEEIAGEIPKLSVAFVAREGDRIAGFLGAELDPGLGRAWLWGPFVEHPAWNLLADRLHERVAAEIPDEINDHELAFDTRNLAGREFAWRHGFRSRKAGSAVMVLPRGVGIPGEAWLPPGAAIEPLPEAFSDAVQDLHDRSFPGTYFAGKQIVEMAGENNLVLVASEGERFLGYAYLAVDLAQHEGFLHFLAVDGGRRRRGVGRALVVAVASRAFAFPEVDRVALTVEIWNVEAIGIYRRLGFVRERTLRGYRKVFPRVRTKAEEVER